MSKTDGQKLRLLALIEILQKKSDEDHFISNKEILRALSGYGIAADRKTVYDDLNVLELFGYDLLRVRGKNGGTKLLSRKFEKAELKLLIDAVSSSKFIPEDKSAVLVEKLTTFSSDYESAGLKRHFYTGNKQKTLNHALLYAVDAINEAIEKRKKITFRYCDRDLHKQLYHRHNGQFYCLSPWELTVFEDNYYMIAYDSAENALRHYRVDKMDSVSVSEEIAEGRETTGPLNLHDYCSSLFGMFSGEKVGVTVRAPDRLIGVFLDRFGMDIPIFPEKDDRSFTTHISVVESAPFFGWLFGLGKGVEIVYPEDMRQRYAASLKDALVSHGGI